MQILIRMKNERFSKCFIFRTALAIYLKKRIRKTDGKSTASFLVYLMCFLVGHFSLTAIVIVELTIVIESNHFGLNVKKMSCCLLPVILLVILVLEFLSLFGFALCLQFFNCPHRIYKHALINYNA